MNIISTDFEGILIIEPNIHRDQRGYFFESYNKEKFVGEGILINFVQDNESKSSQGVLRGLHFQKPPMDQAKLIRVTQGVIYDIAVDLRPKSKTYLRSFGIELSDSHKRQLLIPKGFAHGFVVLSREAIVSYKCDNFYSGEHEMGFRFNDPTFQIDWKLNDRVPLVSHKDSTLPYYNGVEIF